MERPAEIRMAAGKWCPPLRLEQTGFYLSLQRPYPFMDSRVLFEKPFKVEIKP